MNTDQLLALRSRPEGRAVMLQRWSELTFIHWRLAPEVIERCLPDGLKVDLWDGAAYLSFVPFTMSGIRAPRGFAIPGLSRFHEWNLRTYVVGPHGPGVWFFSLDASNLAAVVTARTWFKLPYHFARMNLSKGSESTNYACRRSWPGPPANNCVCVCKQFGELKPAKEGTLDFWLVERYLLYSARERKLYSGRVFHEAYQVSGTEILNLELDLLRAEGFDDIGKPILERQYSPGVNVEIFPLKRV